MQRFLARVLPGQKLSPGEEAGCNFKFGQHALHRARARDAGRDRCRFQPGAGPVDDRRLCEVSRGGQASKVRICVERDSQLRRWRDWRPHRCWPGVWSWPARRGWPPPRGGGGRASFHYGCIGEPSALCPVPVPPELPTGRSQCAAFARPHRSAPTVPAAPAPSARRGWPRGRTPSFLGAFRSLPRSPRSANRGLASTRAPSSSTGAPRGQARLSGWASK